MIDWILSLVPWWAWLVLIGVAVLAAWRILGWQGALAALAGAVAIFGYGKGRADASRDEQARRDRARLDAIKTRKELDDEVDEMGAADVDRDFQRWVRDKPPR